MDYSTATPNAFCRRQSSGYSIFQPPLTPGLPTPSSSQDRLSSITRKRQRPSSQGLHTPRHAVSSGRPSNALQDSYSSVASPAPLANENYQLAGGFDTPTWNAAGRHTPDHEIGQRRPNLQQRREDGQVLRDLSTTAKDEGLLARERNGAGRSSDMQLTHHQGWGQAVLGLVGGVAVKVFDFCRNSVARGFYAGGGQGYSFGAQGDAAQPDDVLYRSSTPLPGGYPVQEHLDFNDEASPSRPPKRLHTDSGSGWLVVDHDLATRDMSPARISTRKTSANLAHLNSPLRASPASSRRSLIPVSRRPSTNHAFASANSPALGRRASVAPNRSPQHTHSRQPSRNSLSRPSSSSNRLSRDRASDSLSPEAQKYIQRQERKDRELDLRTRKMDRQVQDLIRMGQAALGTTIKVEDGTDTEDDMDEGIVSGGRWEKW